LIRPLGLAPHIKSKPGVSLGPVKRPLGPTATGWGRDVRAVACAAQRAASRGLLCLPAVVSPRHIKILAVEDAERFAGVQDLDTSVASVDFEIVPHAIAPLRFGVAIEDGINVVEDLAVKRRAQQLEVLSVRPHQWHGRTRGSAQKLAALRPVSLVPHLLRLHVAAAGVALIGRDQRSDVVSGACSKCARLPAKAVQTRPSDHFAQLGTRGLRCLLARFVVGRSRFRVSTITAWTHRPREYWLR
jgi:hypothetical protein